MTPVFDYKPQSQSQDQVVPSLDLDDCEVEAQASELYYYLINHIIVYTCHNRLR